MKSRLHHWQFVEALLFRGLESAGWSSIFRGKSVTTVYDLRDEGGG